MNVNYNQPASASRCDYAVWQYEYGMWTRWFLDPLYGRDYPPDLVRREIEKGELPGSGLDFVEEGDLAAIAVPTDFLGINYYTRQLSRDNSVPEEENLPVTAALSSDDAENWQEMEGWEVYPEGLFNVLSWLYFEYQPQAIYITENGASWSDAPDNQGRVKDTRRIRFLERHLLSARRAIQSGIPLRGYFAWSLLDNFEWGYGFKQRFGLVWVDFETQKRILKDSALWYRDLIHKDLEAGS
jgi:beta-glucosidase